MSGCVEGILVDLSEPVTEPEDKENPANVYDSIELSRDDHCEGSKQADVSLLSPGRGVGPVLLDITSKTNTPASATPPTVSIEKETFDFDLPLTPVTASVKSDSIDDEEEVFFGPMGFTERCVASVVTSATKETRPMSPLNPRQMAEIFKEANAVATRISSAYMDKKSKPIPKVNLFCSKKLQLESDVINVFDPKAVGDLLTCVSGHRINSEDQGKGAEAVLTLETDLKPRDTDIVHTDSSEQGKCSHGEEQVCDTPSKHHTRSSTYTVNTTPHDLLPSNKRKSLPVVDNTLQVPSANTATTTDTTTTTDGTTITATTTITAATTISAATTTTTATTISAATTITAATSAEKKKSAIKQPGTKIAKSRSFRDCKGMSGIVRPAIRVQPAKAPEEPDDQKPRSRLSMATAGFGLKSSLLPSKLSRLPCGPGLPTASKSTENTNSAPTAVSQGLLTATAGVMNTGLATGNKSTEKRKSMMSTAVTQPAPAATRRSGLPGMRGKAAPTTKLQLMQPGTLQRSALATGQATTAGATTKKPGPMKAFVPKAKPDMKEADPVVPTPAKVEKRVQPKNLLSSSFSTPNKSRASSASSVDTPASSIKKRRSLLKSPTKSRLSSCGALPSPCAGRNNSIITRNSSVGDAPSTPVCDGGTANPAKRRPNSANKQISKYPSIDKLDDSSPSSLKPRKALVVNTPNMPRKRVSQWSPIQRQPHNPHEAAFMCTKKMKKT